MIWKEKKKNINRRGKEQGDDQTQTETGCQTPVQKEERDYKISPLQASDTNILYYLF